MSDSENEEETKNIPIRNSSSETSYDEDEEEPLKQETPTADRQDDEKTLVQTGLIFTVKYRLLFGPPKMLLELNMLYIEV